ncbi:MAG: glutathione S-transferase family protein [Steroidobacteraceae bacterium]
MAIVLYYHPFSRAANVVWMLEEVGVEYELRWVDIMGGAHKSPELLALNPMGKLPILTDGKAVITESAAIALYLGDRYAAGQLAPALDDPARGTYLRWAFFTPSVMEPAAAARASGGEFNTRAVGWGNYEDMLAATRLALLEGPYLLGERFSMADAVLGGTLRYLLMFKMIDPSPVYTDYVARIEARPAFQRSSARNAALIEEHGLKQ